MLLLCVGYLVTVKTGYLRRLHKMPSFGFVDPRKACCGVLRGGREGASSEKDFGCLPNSSCIVWRQRMIGVVSKGRRMCTFYYIVLVADISRTLIHSVRVRCRWRTHHLLTFFNKPVLCPLWHDVLNRLMSHVTIQTFHGSKSKTRHIIIGPRHGNLSRWLGGHLSNASVRPHQDTISNRPLSGWCLCEWHLRIRPWHPSKGYSTKNE